jgi:hypothetical protein
MEKKQGSWLPKSRQKVFEKVTEFTVPYIDANRERFGMKSDTLLGKWYEQEFSSKGYNPYVTAYASWVNPATRTQSDVIRMKAVEKVFIPYYKELYALMKGNPLVTDLDLVNMGFPARRAGGYTPSPIAAEAPEFGITPLTDHRLHIDYYPAGSVRKKGKPDGQHGVEIQWVFSETPIEDVDSLQNSVFDTASPAVLAFHGKDHGRSIYLAMRWENTRGEKGPWSHIEHTYVP